MQPGVPAELPAACTDVRHSKKKGRPGPASVIPFLLAAAAGAIADPIDPVIVTGTWLATQEDNLPGASTVLERREIDARGDAGVLDLLRGIPGIHIVQAGAGGVPQLFMRGGEPNFTVFLLDGIKVNDPNNTRGGSFDLSSVSLADLERVEIVRGPQSSVYGSDGLSGVINLISASGGGPLAAAVEVEAGSKEFRRASARLEGGMRTGGYSLQLTTRDDGEAVEGSGYRADTVSGRLRFAPAAGLRGNLYARYADTGSQSFPEQSGGPSFAVLRTLDAAAARDFSIGGDLDWALPGTLSLQARASHYDRRDAFISPGIAPGDRVPPNGARNDLRRDNAAVRLSIRRGARLQATAGLDFQRESGESEGFVELARGLRLPNSFALDRNTTGVFVEGRVRPDDRWLLQGSVRHDQPDGVSGKLTGGAGAVFSPDGGTTRLRVNWGMGFKLPSFFALGSPLVGEPDLRPEKSRSLEAGFIRRLGDGAEWSVALFDNDYRDLIDFDPDAFRTVNRDHVTTRGLELGGWWPVTPALELRGHATWTDIRVNGSDRRLLQRPDWRGGAGLRWSLASHWTLDLDWLYVNGVLDDSIPTGPQTLDAYHRVDLNLAWRATARWRFALSVDNLLDGKYQEAIGFPASSFGLRLSGRYRLGDE